MILTEQLPGGSKRLFMGLLSRLMAGLSLVLFGSLLAVWFQTAGLSVDVRDIRIETSSGQRLSALLYVPTNATPSTPAPGVLAIHGYINSRETQSGFAIELARRGFVVLALDQTGHGYSDPPAFSEGFGGPAGLAYLRSLAFVDIDRIGLEGHSMGGWAVQMAAANQPDGYQAMVLLGSSTGTFGAPEGTPTAPKNLALVFSRFDEFSSLMWGSETAAGIIDTTKLQALFGTQEPVVEGQRYGDASQGTARLLAMPDITHPGDHLSTEAMGHTLSWFEQQLAQPSNITNQVWYWKELGTLLALLGLAWLVFPFIDATLAMAGPLLQAAPVRPPEQPRWVTGLAVSLTVLVPVISFFPLQNLADSWLPASAWLPQQITNGVLLWAWGNGLFTAVLLLLWFRRQPQVTWRQCGLSINVSQALSTLKVALLVVLMLYLVALLVATAGVDFRFWVVAMKVMSSTQAGMFVIYLVPFIAFFIVQSASLHAQLQLGWGSPGASQQRRSSWYNGLVLSVGFVGLLVLQYVPLLLGGTLLIDSQPLLSIVAFQFVPVMLLVGMISSHCYHRTGSVYLGACINGLWVTWYLVAGTATQALPFWW
jgi:pimeloyl-ACP methyl ester carboxylesterase